MSFTVPTRRPAPCSFLLNRLMKILVLGCTLLSPHLASAPVIEVGLKGLSGAKIDILIGQFGRLTTAIERLASNEPDGVLKTTIDYAFVAFDKSVVCAVDVSVEKAMNRIEKSLPGFDLFRSDHSKACKGETLIPGGSAGLIDRMKFERCFVKQLIVTKPVDFAALSSAYSGLKEVANAGYCSFQRMPEDSTERKTAEANFAAASILLEAYADLGKLNGCTLSTPSKLFDCSRKYGATLIAQIKSAHPEDKSSIDLQALEKQLCKLPAPTDRRKWDLWNFDFSKEAVLSTQTLESYEDAISAFRRSSEVIAASTALRLKAYRKAMDSDLGAISATAAVLKPSNEELAAEFI